MLRIRKIDYEEMRRHAEEAYPLECCGIFAGTFEVWGRLVHLTVRCANAAGASQQTMYAINPRDLVRAQREARDRGFDIVGFYHSHPNHPAQPSPTDLEHAHWIGCSYVITSVEGGEVRETKSFLLAGKMEEDKLFQEEELRVASS